MKKDFHPKYEMSRVTCACGNTFTVYSTIGDQRIEICNICHPFYSGQQKLVDTAGRIEKFKKKYAKKVNNKL